jgi:hypothetical protein
MVLPSREWIRRRDCIEFEQEFGIPCQEKRESVDNKTGFRENVVIVAPEKNKPDKTPTRRKKKLFKP